MIGHFFLNWLCSGQGRNKNVPHLEVGLPTPLTLPVTRIVLPIRSLGREKYLEAVYFENIEFNLIGVTRFRWNF